MTKKALKKIIEEHPILTQDEVVALFKMYDRDDSELIDELFFSNLKLIINLIHKAGFEVEEGLSTGWLGCSNAAKSYRLDGGARFSTHLAWAVRGTLGHLRYHEGRGERLMKNCMPIDRPISFGEGESSLHDVIEDINGVLPFEDETIKDDVKILYKAMKTCLSKQDNFIMHEKLKGKDQVTIGKQLGLTHQAISIAQKRSLKKLQDHYKLTLKL